jgi:hypothetical protein
MRIPYQLHGAHFLPICEVIILGTRYNVPINAIIDSGAVRPIFPKSAARDAGLSLESGKPEGVVFGGSTAIGRLLRTFVLIQSRRFQLDILYVDELKLDYALLGRTTFFNQFNEVAFHERTLERRVHLRG